MVPWKSSVTAVMAKKSNVENCEGKPEQTDNSLSHGTKPWCVAVLNSVCFWFSPAGEGDGCVDGLRKGLQAWTSLPGGSDRVVFGQGKRCLVVLDKGERSVKWQVGWSRERARRHLRIQRLPTSKWAG